MPKLKLPKISLDQRPSIREKIFFLLVMGGLLLLFFNVFWTPKSAVLASEQAELSGIEAQRDGLQRLIESTASQLKVQQSVPKREKKVSERVKSMLERRVVDPLSEINAVVGRISGRKFAGKVKVDDVNIGELVEKDNYTMVPITLHVAGKYGGMRGFFISLEKIDRPVIVRRFDLQKGQDESSVVGSIDIELYIVKR